MDERQAKIKEGAGLEESRLNTDFIDFMQKWSTPVLVVMAVAFGAYYLMQRRSVAQVERVNTAFLEYELVRTADAPSPTSLIQIAEDFADVKGVAVMARLRAADLLMQEALGGAVLGAQLNSDGEVEDESARLNEEEIANRMDDAQEQYRLVLDRSGATPGEAQHAIGAAFGLAAVAETKGDLEAAKGYYERIIEIGTAVDYPQPVNIAENRKRDIEQGLQPPKLWDEADLPAGKMIAATRNYGLVVFREGDDVDAIRDEAYTGEYDASQGPIVPPSEEGETAEDGAGPDETGPALPESGSLGDEDGAADGAPDEPAPEETAGDDEQP